MFYDVEASGQRIRQLRILNGHTQEKLAHFLNIDRSFYSRMESGQKGCSVDLFVRLSAFYHVSLDYLILGKTAAGADTAGLKADIGALIAHLETVREAL